MRIPFFKFLVVLSVFSCSDIDDAENVNEEEVITSMNITCIPADGSPGVELSTIDLDGDGPNLPDVTVVGKFKIGVEYTGVIEFLNESVTPTEDITTEIETEADEHQVFFTINGSYTLGYIATNKDSKGHDLGTKFKLTDIAGSAGKYKLTVTLIHQPKKPNNGLTDAGGSTDIEATFDIELVD